MVETTWHTLPTEIQHFIAVLAGSPCLLLTFRLASHQLRNMVCMNPELVRNAYAQQWHHEATVLPLEEDWTKMTFLRLKRHLMQLRPLETTFAQRFDELAADALSGVSNAHIVSQMRLADWLDTVYNLLYWRSRVEVLLHDWFDSLAQNSAQPITAAKLRDLATYHTYLTEFHQEAYACMDGSSLLKVSFQVFGLQGRPITFTFRQITTFEKELGVRKNSCIRLVADGVDLVRWRDGNILEAHPPNSALVQSWLLGNGDGQEPNSGALVVDFLFGVGLISDKYLIEDNRLMKEPTWPGLIQHFQRSRQVEEGWEQPPPLAPTGPGLKDWTTALRTQLPFDDLLFASTSLLDQQTDVGGDVLTANEKKYYKLRHPLHFVAPRVWKWQFPEQNPPTVCPPRATLTLSARGLDSSRWATSNGFVSAFKPTMKILRHQLSWRFRMKRYWLQSFDSQRKPDDEWADDVENDVDYQLEQIRFEQIIDDLDVCVEASYATTDQPMNRDRQIDAASAVWVKRRSSARYHRLVIWFSTSPHIYESNRPSGIQWVNAVTGQRETIDESKRRQLVVAVLEVDSTFSDVQVNIAYFLLLHVGFYGWKWKHKPDATERGADTYFAIHY